MEQCKYATPHTQSLYTSTHTQPLSLYIPSPTSNSTFSTLADPPPNSAAGNALVRTVNIFNF